MRRDVYRLIKACDLGLSGYFTYFLPLIVEFEIQ